MFNNKKTVIQLTLIGTELQTEFEGLIEKVAKPIKLKYDLQKEEITEYKDDIFTSERTYYTLTTTQHDTALSFVVILDSHKETPFLNFEIINEFDFSITCFSGKRQQEINAHIADKNNIRVNINSEWQENAIIQSVETLKKLTDKIESIETYLTKSGLLHYQELTDGIIGALDKEGMVNGEYLREILFRQQH